MQNMENEGFFPLFIRATVKPRNFYLKHTKKVTINAKISIYQSKTINPCGKIKALFIECKWR